MRGKEISLIDIIIKKMDPKENLYLRRFYEEGKEEGKREAKKETVLALHRELRLSPEKIAKVLKVPEDFVREVLSGENQS